MKKIKVGIIKEGKVPVDHRVALTPIHCAQILREYSDIELYVQKSDIRCYKDKEFAEAGAFLVDDVSHCEILFGVKEIPIPELIADKTCLFFSHTLKAQPYNRNLLLEIFKKNIQLVDYECLKDQNGQRVVAFGRYAGIVGAYNGVLAYGKRYNLFEIKRANQCFDMVELWQQFQNVTLPAIKIAVTGSGRVAQGALEVLDGMKIKKVSKTQFLDQKFSEAVYCQLDVLDYNERIDGEKKPVQDFFQNPKEYQSSFAPITKVADLFIAAAYWDPAAPVLFTKEDMNAPDFNIKVIADITCDIEGSVASTLKATTIAEPWFDYNPISQKEEKPFTSEKNVTVMSVDNLPCELPRDASTSFGDQLLEHVFAALISDQKQRIIEEATIAVNGDLGSSFEYLRSYVQGK